MEKYSPFAKFNKRIQEALNPYLGKVRCKMLNNTDFTIISNNCWGGYVYRYFGLPYKSPTIGLFIYSDDYIKFVKNLKYYMELKLQFIDFEKSRHYEEIVKHQQTNVPIGILDDVEIVFLHYKTKEEALKKWTTRKQRVNWNNIIIKNSQMNLCVNQHIADFDNIKDLKKIMFVNNPMPQYKSTIYFRGYENDREISNDTFYWNKYINIIKLINSPITEYKIF